MGPIWGRQDPGGPHVDPMNFAIWGVVDNDPFIQHSTDSDWVEFQAAASSSQNIRASIPRAHFTNMVGS